jgi:HAD superfamily hydrolase (TIGR01509 family)
VATPTAVLFDNDGLLLDTESVWTRGEQDMFERRGREFTLEDKQAVIGQSAKVAGQILADRLDEPGNAEGLIAELDEIVIAALEEGIDPMVGARELVAALRESEMPLGLVSNSPRRFITRALELVGMDGQFDSVISGHEVAEPKPAPDAYLAACEELGVEPATAIALEDSPTGVAAAKAAGLVVIGVPSLPGIQLDQADHLAESLQEARLVALLGLAA